MTIDIEAIRDRHARATPGPYRWFGYRRSWQLDLMGARGQEVMTFKRWGMSSAQPVFRRGGLLIDASELLADCDPANPSRARIAGIPHPDAEFIAASWKDVADLLAEVDRLRAELASPPNQK